MSSPAAATTPVAMGVRTGPLGRAVRLLGAVFLGAGLYLLIDIGIADFRMLPGLGDPGPWILTAVVAILVVDLVLRFVPLPVRASLLVPARRLVLAAIGLVVAVFWAITIVGGSVWGSPLSDLVWVVDVGYLAYATASLLLALVLGTPGCENLAWAELLARLRGAERRIVGVWCIGGLHVVDNWELGRRARRSA